jgi:SpoVK/Ycf46/Vps4 family AAA+-type ATPase
VYLLYARLLFRSGEPQRAAQQYRRALEFDPALADAEFADQLGLSTATASTPEQPFEGKLAAAWDLPSTFAELDTEKPTLTFQDVGGMDAVKEEIRMKIVHPLQHPELYRAYGKPIGGGMLMYGPPGCGKTHLARATAGEIKATFLAVGISDVLDMWIGNSEKNLHELFEQARRSRPCVLFFDEVDALGASRSDLRHSGGRHLINQFLAEMDGVQDSNEGVLILAATNAPWHIDPAFRRPGRFDRVLFVPPPDSPARSAILRILLRGKPLADIDFDQLARRAEGFSGADLKAIVDLAVEDKLRQAIKEGIPKPLTTKDLQGSLGQVKPSTREWFATARNYALYSNQGGAYDDVLRYLKLT